MLDAAKMNPCTNVYSNGAITTRGACRAGEKAKKVPRWLQNKIPGAGSIPDSPASYTFVTGEKFWVTKIEVKDAGKEPGMTFSLFSDENNKTRFATSLLIPFEGPTPTPDDALKLAAAVITVAPSEDAKQQAAPQQEQGAQSAAGAQATAQTQASTPPAPAAQATSDPPPNQIAAPPPPAADPANITEGLTKDQVVAALGQPVKTSKIGAKEIYFYKDMKIVFVDGKVKDVQ